MEPKIKIILAEDKALMRKSLIALLKEYPNFEIIGEASNGKDLLNLLKDLEPDIVLLDIEMPVMNGIEALKIIRTRFPEVKVIVLSIHNDLVYVRNSLALGARGYLAKDCLPEQLERAILDISKKGFYLEDGVSKDLLHDTAYSQNISTGKQTFSSRELEVLKELCRGKTEKEIALMLNISHHTVHFHRMNIYTKTNTHNLAGLLNYAKLNVLLL